MKKLKIGLVIDDSLDKPDGVQQYVKIVGNWLESNGHEIHYLISGDNRTDNKNVHSLSKSIKVNFNHNIMTTPMPSSINKVKSLLDELRLDVIHIQMPYSPFMAGKVIKSVSNNTAVVGTFHILPFSHVEAIATRALALIVSKTNKRFDHIFSVSEPAKLFAKSHFRVGSSVLPNAIDIKRYSQKEQPMHNNKKLNIVFLGRLVDRKGCMELMKALDSLGPRLQNKINVHIAGKGPLLNDLKKYVTKKKLDRIVEFLGFIDENDKPSLLAKADIAVFPSKGGESFGIVLLEAMAAGSKVVLAGNNEGYNYVMNYETKQIINPANINDFCHKLKYFIENKQAREQAHLWQKSHVEKFDIEIIGKKLLREYRRILREKQNIR